MKRIYRFLIACFACFACCSIFSSSDVFAGQISSVNIYGYKTYWQNNNLITDFYVTLDCGSGCEISKSFKCCGTHSQYEWTGKPRSIKETWKGVDVVKNGEHDDYYDYYDIVLYPGSTAYQPACGQIKKKRGRLVITGKNIYNDYNIMSGGSNLGHQEISAVGLVYAQYKNLWDNRTDRYKFIGWKEKGKNRPGLGNIIQDTNSNHSPYVANPTSGYDNWNKRVYQRLFYNLKGGEAKDIYAYYAPACTITIDSGEGTTVSAYRHKSVYSGMGDLPNGFDIYYGDEIGITFGLKDGYRWVSRSVNGSDMGVSRVNHKVGHRTSAETGTCKDLKIVARAEPAEEDDGEVVDTNVSMEIKKNDETNFDKNIRYVKPGDTVYYRTRYNPNTQSAAEEKPNNIRINNGETIANGNNLSTRELFNRNSDGEWTNYFDVLNSETMSSLNFANSGCGKFGGRYRCSYNVGDSGQKEEINSYVVERKDVGKRLKEEAVINLNWSENYNLEDTTETVFVEGSEVESSGGAAEGSADAIETEAYEIEGGDDNAINPTRIRKKTENNNSSYDISTELKSDDVQAVVPYNFRNETRIATEENKVVYAGESDGFGIAVETHPRTNSLTDGTYATTFSNAKLKVRLCNEDETNCYGTDSVDDDTNEIDIGGLNIGKKYSTEVIHNSVQVNLNIPDVDAGSVVCLRSKMYPADSGDESNWQNSDGSATWTEWSDKKCFKVAKRPSLQVWGGSVYSAGMIDMMPSAKNNLYGYEDEYPYKMIGEGDHRVFGSWAELSLAANGNVNGLASGAGTGYAQAGNAEDAKNGKALESVFDNLGGSAEGISTDYCLRSTLSFANTRCNEAVGGLGGGLQGKVSSDKKALISKFTGGNGGGYKLYNESETEGIDGFYGEIEEEDGIEKKKVTRVIVSNGDFAINGDIKYLENGYTNLEDVPKIIIYAKNDINIKCDVTRIDAVLIAENNINTCSDSDDINAEKNSKQLKINGSVISNTLTLNRTYGAAKGVNSVIPAEIVNYDTSLYLWANKQADVTTSGKMTEAYIGELAPRY